MEEEDEFVWPQVGGGILGIIDNYRVRGSCGCIDPVAHQAAQTHDTDREFNGGPRST